MDHIQNIQDHLQNVGDRDDAPVAIRDILVELRHLCHEYGLVYAVLDGRAGELYRQETGSTIAMSDDDIADLKARFTARKLAAKS